MLTWLASRDQLPNLPAAPHRQGGFFSWFTSRDRLPANPPDASPAPQSFLRWLFTIGAHERLESQASTKEVPLHEP